MNPLSLPNWTRWLTIASLGVLSACSSAPEKPQPSPLPAVSGAFKVQKVWSNQVGAVNTPLIASVHGQQVAVASTTGQLALMDASSGRDVWRLNLGAAIQAGVGGDGQRFAVVTQNNELVAVESGRVIWRQTLPALSYTPPLVAGARVFVLTGDRAVSAFDGATGQKLWTQQRPGDPLVLRQAGLLMPLGDQLLVGWGGRLAALNPLTGAVRWETLVGTTRGRMKSSAWSTWWPAPVVWAIRFACVLSRPRWLVWMVSLAGWPGAGQPKGTKGWTVMHKPCGAWNRTARCWPGNVPQAHPFGHRRLCVFGG